MKTILLVGSGSEVYRRYIVEALAKKYRIVLLEHRPVSWQAPFIDTAFMRPLDDIDDTIKFILAIPNRHEIQGVLTYSEPLVELTCAIAAALKLPGNTPLSAQACRDKSIMRQLFAEAQVPSARSHGVASLAEAIAAAAAITYPVVIKPRSFAGSIGVVRADNEDELKQAFATASSVSPAHYGEHRGLLVEEYLDGPDISVESIVHDGDVKPVVITRRRSGLAPYFEQIEHIVAPLEPPGDPAAIYQAVIGAHKALHVKWGVTPHRDQVNAARTQIDRVGGAVGGGFHSVTCPISNGYRFKRRRRRSRCGGCATNEQNITAGGGDPVLLSSRRRAHRKSVGKSDNVIDAMGENASLGHAVR